MENLFIHNGKPFRAITAGPWTGYEPVAIPSAEPSVRWSGAKIPLALWSEVISFLEWSYDLTKSETLANLFYNGELRQWAALVLPQEGHTGMTVRLLDEHPNRIPTYQRLGRGWTPMGTVHHHCSASAFQSNTDEKDEVTKEGLHITIGDLGKDKYSIHARTSFRHQINKADLREWFDWTPEPAIAQLPAHFQQNVFEWELTKPRKAEFPDWWKENVIKVERPPSTVVYNGGFGGAGAYAGPIRMGGFVRHFVGEMKSLAEKYNASLTEVLQAVQSLNEPFYEEIVSSLIDNRIGLEEAAEELAKEVAREQPAEETHSKSLHEMTDAEIEAFWEEAHVVGGGNDQ